MKKKSGIVYFAFMVKNNRGVAQSTVIVVISIVTLVLLAGVIIYYVKGQIERRNLDRKVAQEMAEYGMTLALQKISENPLWSEGFRNVRYQQGGDGYFSVVIEKVGDSTYRALSTGYISSMKTTISCAYKLETLNDTLRPKTLNMEYQ